VKLTIQPEAGIAPVLTAIRHAKKTIDIVIFRLDIKAVVDALSAAVMRGVTVHALVAHTNRGGEKTLRKLEQQMLESGITVSRSSEEFGRYHGKILIIDERVLHLFAFNLTSLDVTKSRSFGLAITQRGLVQEALKLVCADRDRKPYAPADKHLVVSPENSRARLASFIKGARKQLFIYDVGLTDPMMLRLLSERHKAGVDIRVIGKAGKGCPVPAQKYPGKRLHVRAIFRDGRQAFVGSQSLREQELDKRREVGVLVSNPKVVREMLAIFEGDWLQTELGAESKKKDSKPAA
jgi:cardiolipin synthase